MSQGALHPGHLDGIVGAGVGMGWWVPGHAMLGSLGRMGGAGWMWAGGGSHGTFHLGHLGGMAGAWAVTPGLP